MFSLRDKGIIITGAASGIGRAIVLKCLKHEALVFAIDIDESKLKKLKEEVSSKNLKIIKADVSKPSQIKKVFSFLNKNRYEANCLINNAGIYNGKSILEYSDNEINKVIDINIKSAVHFSKLFAEHIILKNKKGIILNMTSVSGQDGSSDAIYGLSKSALIGLTKSNAINFSPYIRVNAIAPGIVNTQMQNNIPKERMKNYRKSELIKDKIEPIDVANTAIFLLSDLSKNYTGSVFDINNGCYLR